MNPARDVVDEANAAIGAALSTLGVPTDLEHVLGEIQQDLLDLADTLDKNEKPPTRERLNRIRDTHGTPVLPRGFAVLGGFSQAAGLLKLAGAIARRAAHTLQAGPAREYLDLLGDVLPALAFHIEEHERAQVPFGMCTNVVGRTERSD